MTGRRKHSNPEQETSIAITYGGVDLLRSVELEPGESNAKIINRLVSFYKKHKKEIEQNGKN